jgi:hypothetical protein
VYGTASVAVAALCTACTRCLSAEEVHVVAWSWRLSKVGAAVCSHRALDALKHWKE